MSLLRRIEKTNDENERILRAMREKIGSRRVSEDELEGFLQQVLTEKNIRLSRTRYSQVIDYLKKHLPLTTKRSATVDNSAISFSTLTERVLNSTQQRIGSRTISESELRDVMNTVLSEENLLLSRTERERIFDHLKQHLLPASSAASSTESTGTDAGLKHHIFLSYKREDADIMQRVKAFFTTQNLSVWTDERIQKGTPQWQRAIEDAIKHTGVLVCLLSPEAAQSRYVRGEIDIASLLQKPLYFVLVRGSREECIIYPYTSHQMADIREAQRFQPELLDLAAIIRERLSHH